jgi:hypothetical protein
MTHSDASGAAAIEFFWSKTIRDDVRLAREAFKDTRPHNSCAIGQSLTGATVAVDGVDAMAVFEPRRRLRHRDQA